MAKRYLLLKRLGVLVTSLLVSVIAACAVNGLFGLDLDWKLHLIRVKVFGDQFADVVQPDDRIGWRLRPSTSHAIWNPDFTCTYTIGPDGNRIVPGAPETEPVVAFLGGSFVMGVGVNDDEVFLSILQRDHWTSYRVRNLGCGAYGTSQVLLRLEEEFEAGRKIHTAVYCWIWSHLVRNYSRRHWLEVLGPRAKLPLYELERGKLVFKGTVGLDQAMDNEDPALIQREWDVTRALLGALDRLCRMHSTHFLVVLLPDHVFWAGDALAAYAKLVDKNLASICRSLRIECLDLTRHPALLRPGSYFPRDGHPTAPWHSVMAGLLARGIDPKTGQVRPLAAQRAPGDR